MEEDISLPGLSWDPTTDTILNNRPRKRARHSPPPVSSDPPIFSSDDDPSAENYMQDRRKRIFRGPWYHHRPAPESESSSHTARDSNPKQSKRTFERQYDSGIWLGSDGTDIEETIEGLESVSCTTSDLPLSQSSQVLTVRNLTPSPEELAQRQIDLCLETGNEIIDLSSRNLTHLSNATIRPLAAFTRVPPVTEGVFARLDPRLKIFLASNRLTTLPEQLFNLHNLTVLSLRGNKIYELPPAIGRLHKLTELNISQNSLQYLPFEILDLFSDTSRLQSFQIHPNLFHERQYPPVETSEAYQKVTHKVGLANRTRPRRGAICGILPNARRRSWHPQWKISYTARTEVRYLDINGAHMKGPTLSNHTLFGPRKFTNGILIAGADDIPTPPNPRGNSISRVPSLLELALRACSRSPRLPYLAAELPEDCPESFLGLLGLVAAKKESGGTKCTICKRDFIIPRTEWIEWWQIRKAIGDTEAGGETSQLKKIENERDVVESMVPLMRRGCSWLCVPEKTAVEEESANTEGNEPQSVPQL